MESLACGPRSHLGGMAYTGSASERLAAVRVAIDNALVTQEYALRGRRQVNPLLATLFRKEELLEAQVVQESQGNVSLGMQGRPS